MIDSFQNNDYIIDIETLLYLHYIFIDYFFFFVSLNNIFISFE
jgi:hypothetical protein